MDDLSPAYLFVLLAMASFAFTAFKSFQTQNIIHEHYLAVLPTSYCIVLMEVFIIVKVSAMGIGWIVLPLGLGGACGCWFSMVVHKKLLRQGKDGKQVDVGDGGTEVHHAGCSQDDSGGED